MPFFELGETLQKTEFESILDSNKEAKPKDGMANSEDPDKIAVSRSVLFTWPYLSKNSQLLW